MFLARDQPAESSEFTVLFWVKIINMSAWVECEYQPTSAGRVGRFEPDAELRLMYDGAAFVPVPCLTGAAGLYPGEEPWRGEREEGREERRVGCRQRPALTVGSRDTGPAETRSAAVTGRW